MKRLKSQTKTTDQVEVVLKLSGGVDKNRKKMKLLLKKRRAKYGIGTHGSAGFQRKTLGTTGTRHESEHVVGYNVYAEDYDRKHGQGKIIEMQGLAYLEVKPLHRAHPGTGSGAVADEYRDIQRGILQDGQSGHTAKTASSAVQFNQLEYAHLPSDAKGDASDLDFTIANISYEVMVRNGQSITFYDGTGHTSFQISQVERAEMLLAYEIRKTGQWPTQQRIAEVLKSCGLDPIVQKNARTGEDIVL
ncbi:hypothetical protein [Methylococcus sp. EFPC2]|uniref:hypothetical protein n=1 Tax=Methylococcus sp. EFPC2 TaxID=2812648 RepID=UPI001967CBFE|nr:hypothetical protein [Methylococcus sp. EFPC2]QSA97014.1 hypothetical protein JWZ97_17710 [Methylococcus sp. EFPC2]